MIKNLSALPQIAHLYPAQAPAVELKKELGAASALLPVSEISRQINPNTKKNFQTR